MMPRSAISRVCLLATSAYALAVCGLSTNAYAQNGAGQQAQISSDGDIIVTANRSASLLSKTPVAITAVTGDGLIKQGVTDVLNLDELVPNLSIDRAFGVQITLRGVSSTDGSEKGDPSVAFLRDGVYIARPQAIDGAFFDLERVEVLRGPQGTLYGKNTTAGVVSLVSAKPKHAFEGSLDAAYGNFDQVNLTGMINVPIGESVAIRAAANWDRSDSFLIRGAGGASIDPMRNNRAARLSALFEITPNVELVIRGDYSKFNGKGGNGFYNLGVPTENVYANPTGASTPYTLVNRYQIDGLSSKQLRTLTYPEIDTDVTNRQWGIQAELNAHLGFFDVTYVGSFRDFEVNSRASFNRGAVPTTFHAIYRQNSQEIRLAFGNGSPLHGQAGGYYFREKTTEFNFFLIGLGGDGNEFGFYRPFINSKSYAAFGQLTYDVTPDLHLTGGLRYSNDQKSWYGINGVRNATTKVFLSPGINDADRSWSKMTWKVGVDYDVSNLGLLYANVSTGYKAGGFNDGCLAGPGAPSSCTFTEDTLFYDPETITAYEAGFKVKLADDALRLNGSLFHYDYKSLQLAQNSTCNGGPCGIIRNAGAVKTDGVELEVIIQPVRNHQINLAINYLDARYSEFFPDPLNAPTFNLKGNSLSRSPKWTISAGYTATIPLSSGADIEAGVRTRFSSSFIQTELSTYINFVQDSFTKTDLSLTYNAPDRRWYIQGYIRNLEDNVTVSNVATDLGAITQLTDPRTFGVRAGVKF